MSIASHPFVARADAIKTVKRIITAHPEVTDKVTERYFFGLLKRNRPRKLVELVNNGTLTPAEADEIFCANRVLSAVKVLI